MDDRYRRLTDLARPTGGFFVRATARRAGFSDTAITDHVRSGRWQAWWGQVFSPAGFPATWENRLRAAALRLGPDAVVTGRSAARLWGLPDFDRTDALEFLVPRAHTPRLRGVRVARVAEILPSDVVSLPDHPGLAVAGVTRTLRSLARVVGGGPLLRAAAEGYRRGLTTPADLQRAVLAHPGTTGNPALTLVIQRLDVRMARARSVAETDVIVTLVDLGYEGFEVNARRRLRCGLRVELDILLAADDEHDEAVLEVDGERYHGDVLAQRRDRERRRRIAASGYAIAVVPAKRAGDRRYVDEVVRGLRRRSERPASVDPSSG